ncbi:hypothetical protein H1S01_07000 [Heliobacterium chlorum]|uniref:NusG domain-containing protein n=1 Tax=Heliobacterium chlorum TaxID=2698 RepID=A0ABR7T239_HELCL|nr:hypothetical protein [Heliobacterium chlorum]MBC9784257.1 hypothetical protein [Heliobacterium chlorum]
MFSTKRTIVMMVVFILMVSSYGLFTLFVHGQVVQPESVIIDQIKEEGDNALYLKGDTRSSSLGFSGYHYRVDHNIIYLQLRYSLVSRIHRTGNFEIKIPEGLKDVTKVYLEGADERDIKLIWSR